MIVDGSPVSIRSGDTVLTSLLRDRGLEHTPGTLCCDGDCPHCLATIDGTAYVRMCQRLASDGQVVEPHRAHAAPQVVAPDDADVVARRHVHSDLVVIGGGSSGRAVRDEAIEAGRTVDLFDAGEGAEAVGIYAGPTVLVRRTGEMLEVSCNEIVVATGASEVLPACPGNDLAGLLTPRAARRLAEAGVELGTVLIVRGATSTGSDLEDLVAGLGASIVDGELIECVAAPGARSRVGSVVVAPAGDHAVGAAHACDTVIVDLGLQPRDALSRMGEGLPVRTVGDAAIDHPVPPCPRAGIVCPCSEVTVDQLQSVWDRGFREMELVKRATLAGTGTCQGAGCLPHLRSFLSDRGLDLPAPFTARPLNRQITIAEAAAGEHHPVRLVTALDGEHRALGATMEAMGGWMRPWTYGDTVAEYTAVRERVSLGDVSTLGKFLVSGPDAESFLQRIYPTDIATIKPGRCRYALVLNEAGYVLDDGMIGRIDDTRFTLTFTSGGASVAEMWLRDWVGTDDVRILNQTLSVGAINVTGPRATELLATVGLTERLPFLGFAEVTIDDVPCTVFRLSFTGEASYELHHPASASVGLWRSLLDAGRQWDIAPHGLEALMWLRLEKGHIVVGQDTDYDSTPARLDHGWAVNMHKGAFLGRPALERTSHHTLDRQLVGLTTSGRAPLEGATIWDGDRYAGYVTSAAWSPSLGRGVMLAWMYLADDQLADQVRVEDLVATRSALPFYDPTGERPRA